MNGRTGGAAGFAPTFSGIISHHCMPELNAPRAARGILWPCAWALAATCVLGVGFSAVPWPLGDVYPNLHRAVTLSWRETFVAAFDRGVEYRPLLTIFTKIAYEMAGLRLWIYQLFVLLQLLAVLVALIVLLRPAGQRRVIAACIAVTCALGLHSSRSLFLFVPINQYTPALLLLLLAAILALENRPRAVDWLYFPMTVGALFFLESGVLMLPLMVVLYLVKAPGASTRALVCTVAGVVLYAGIRLSLTSEPLPTVGYAESGLGFADVDRGRLREIFEHAPWLFWSYNVVGTFLSVVVAEPNAGKYRFIESLLHGNTPPWMWFRIVLTVATTVIAVTGILARRTTRDRWLVTVGLVLLVCGSGLGYLYTRERIALSAGFGYVILVYVGISLLLERPATPARRAAALAVVAVIACGWLVRNVEMYLHLRDTAWEYHLEWTDRYEAVRGSRPETPLLKELRAAALARRPRNPTRDRAWSYSVFEREYERAPRR
jgi:hypothetical protein